ncbi:hypothetical protein Pla163_07840 [Planctomycetes bacterium Pla163]|uniref:Uncharacterized protein n=2 Tax=Rohdeia mirabilis TaxID=2528008 RepID=A0A518CWT3_9BACT|nr:hypothetical protein Pla163_07840 [Planctomycetes bacterium Pla163]
MTFRTTRVGASFGLALLGCVGLAVWVLRSASSDAPFVIEQEQVAGLATPPGVDADLAQDGTRIQGLRASERAALADFELGIETDAALAAADPDRLVRFFDPEGQLLTQSVRAVVVTTAGIPLDAQVTGWLERPEADHPQLLLVAGDGLVPRHVSIGSAGPIDLVLHRAGSVELRVIDVDERPVLGRYVRIHLGQGGELTRAHDQRGSSPGRPFEVRQLGHGVSFSSRLASDELVPPYSTPERTARSWVNAVTKRRDRHGIAPEVVVDMLTSGGGGYSDAEGRVRVASLDPSEGYRWSVYGGCSAMEPELVETVGDRRISSADGVVVEPDRRTTYTAIVEDHGTIAVGFDTTGLGAVEHAAVKLERRDGQLGDAGADRQRGEAQRLLEESDGGIVSLRFRGLPPGDYRLSVLCGSYARGLRFDERAFTVDDAAVDLGVLGQDLERTTIAFGVTDPFGRPVTLPEIAQVEPKVTLTFVGPLERAGRPAGGGDWPPRSRVLFDLALPPLGAVVVEGLEWQEYSVDVDVYRHASSIGEVLEVVPDERPARVRVRPDSETIVPLHVAAAMHTTIAVETDRSVLGGYGTARLVLVAESTDYRVLPYVALPDAGRSTISFYPCPAGTFRLVGRVERTVVPAQPDGVMVCSPFSVPTGRGMLVDTIVHLTAEYSEDPVVVTASIGATIEGRVLFEGPLPLNPRVRAVPLDPFLSSLSSMRAVSFVERVADEPGVGSFFISGLVPNSTYAVGRYGEQITTGAEGSVARVELGVEFSDAEGE